MARSRGRPRIYTNDEKKSKHREQALKSYYRRKALKEHLREPVNGDEVSFPFMANSKVLGDFYEEVTFKRTNGVYRKKQEWMKLEWFMIFIFVINVLPLEIIREQPE